MTIALITNHPAPYRQRLYGALARRIEGFHVLYETRESKARGWGESTSDDYPHRFMTGRTAEAAGHREIAAATARALRRMEPEAVIASGFGASALAAREWCARHRRAYVGLSGATALADRAVTGARLRLRSVLARSARGWIAYGPEARRYLIDIGASRAGVLAAGNPYGIEPGDPSRAGGALRVGFVGQLHWRKGWWVPIQAARVARANGVDVELTIVGNGPCAPLVERALRGLDARWRPFVAPAAIAAFYSEVDLVVAPSLVDQWPIVLSEAAAMGTPAIGTVEPCSGVPAELTTAGEPVRPGSVHGVAQAFAALSSDEAHAAAVQRAVDVRERISPGAVAERWATHLRTIL